MNNVNIYLPDGDINGTVHMRSTASPFTAIRVKREDVDRYSYDLDHQGVYMLLIGTDTIYVGQTSHDFITKRIFNTHSGDIDSAWHTLVAFPNVGTSVSTDEMLYLENAMCEYVHTHGFKCATTNPSREKCNVGYRNRHFNLSTSSIYACMSYIKDIESYIKFFWNSMFIPGISSYGGSDSRVGGSVNSSVGSSNRTFSVGGNDGSDSGVGGSVGNTIGLDNRAVSVGGIGSNGSSETDVFCLVKIARDVHSIAEIPIHQGHTGQRKTIVKAGSKISNGVLQFGGADKIIALRQQLEAEGKLIDRIMQVDYEFPSQSAAGCFVNGGSFNGNEWKRVSDATPLKQLL